MEGTPEVRLLCHVIGSAIAEEPADAARRHVEPYETRFFVEGGGLDCYCAAIGLRSDFVREQIVRSMAYDA